MDLSNPLTYVFATPFLLLAGWLIFELQKGGSATFSSPWLSFTKTDPNNMAEKFEALSKEVERLRTKIDLVEAKDVLKYDFKARLHKVNKRFTTLVEAKVETIFHKTTEMAPDAYRPLDEYRLVMSNIQLLEHVFTRKGMNDFDRNGFLSVGIRYDGIFDPSLVSKYLDSKPAEYEVELLDAFEQSERPLTLLEGMECATGIVDRKIVVPVNEFEACIIAGVREVSSDIQELYRFIVARYRAIHEAHGKFSPVAAPKEATS